jgi:DNA repair protein RecN (Recombination protein N)
MLQSLHIRNYAIIKAVDIVFDTRLNIITGETGAGKSILMGALGLVLGNRADSKVLHNPEEKCVVEGSFAVKAYKLQSFFIEHELDYDDTCLIRREIAPGGKSRAFINDTPVTLPILKLLGEQLIDIVSQHQTLELNEEQFQLTIIDAIADSKKYLDNYQLTFRDYKQTEKQLSQLIERETKARADEDYFNFLLTELVDAKLIPDEQTQLETELELLSHAEQIQIATANAANILTNSEQSVVDSLQQIKTNLQAQAKHHKGLAELVTRIESTLIELKDVGAELEQLTEQTQANPQRLQQIDERLQLLFSLQKKHRAQNNAELLAIQQQLETNVASIGNLQQEIKQTETKLALLKTKLTSEAQLLTEKRTKAIPTIEQHIQQLLKQVEMPDARLKVAHTLTATYKENGLDELQFLFAANKGQSFQPINKVASGGELSRLMLCIKSLIADKMALPSIVFDEIDTGISGEAALKVSQVMKNHAQHHQVIAITHLPQIAGKADTHFFVYKTTDKTTTHTHIKTLNAAERLEEIARMLHGANPSAKVLEAAKELIG